MRGYGENELAIAGAIIGSLALIFAGSFWTSSHSLAGYDEGAAALMRGDYATALAELRPACWEGDPRAQVLLGRMYQTGLGVSKDISLAVHWYRKAAEQEFPTAQFALGALYRKGEGVPKDYAEAARWYRKAAEQNLAAGQISLGAAHFYGHGVPQDYVQAHKWFSLALTGISFGTANLDIARMGIAMCESQMIREQIREAKRLRDAWKLGAGQGPSER